MGAHGARFNPIMFEMLDPVAARRRSMAFPLRCLKRLIVSAPEDQPPAASPADKLYTSLGIPLTEGFGTSRLRKVSFRRIKV